MDVKRVSHIRPDLLRGEVDRAIDLVFVTLPVECARMYVLVQSRWCIAHMVNYINQAPSFPGNAGGSEYSPSFRTVSLHLCSAVL